MSTKTTTMWNDSLNDDDDDFIFDVLGIKDHSPMNQDRNSPIHYHDSSSGSVQVILEGEKHIFRHAKEVQKGSRGGYLKGMKHLTQK